MTGMPVRQNLSQGLTRVGVIGGGQLAWMMAGAAKSLGISLSVQTPHATDPAVSLTTDPVLAAVDDATATTELAHQCDVITFENEFVNLAALFPLVEQGVCFRPRLEALACLLDKYDQLCYLQNIGLPVPKFEELTKPDQPSKIKSQIDFPVVIKTRRHGYDGQGTFIILDQESLDSTWAKLGDSPLLLQEFVPFERELAVIAARSVTGEVRVYPVVETYQKDQVCRWVMAPANLTSDLTDKIEGIARTLLNSLDGVGVFGIELFLTSSNQVFVNEIAPRTHNSGHFSLDACETSQFEQHLRAVCGLPLGNPRLNCAGAVMVNLLGYENAQSDYQQKRQQLAQIPRSTVYWYGKTESRLGRKLGHVTVLLTASSGTQRQAEAIAITQMLEDIWYGV